ncbi:MAG: glycosyltransferase [Spirochaetales bacterium]|nr:glycosyltransferase [Spirochaetales bacterium]
MTIGFFSDCWEPQINGVVVSMRNLERALAQRGHRVFTYAPAFGSERKCRGGVFRQRAVTYPFQREFAMAVPFSRRALRLARSQKIDIVHGHTEFSLGLVASTVARRLGVPFVFTLHTLWKFYTHYLFWGLLPDNLLVAVMRRFYLKPDYLIAPSSKIKSYLEKEFRVEAHIETIPTGLDLDLFHRASPSAEEKLRFRAGHGLAADDLVMIFAGRLGREKSIDVLIEAVARLQGSRPRLKLLLVGDGPARTDLERYAEKLGVRRSVAFTGYLPHAMLPLAYKSSDCYAIASTTESQGLVTVEAMASGLPVLVRDDAAHLDIIGRAENGMVFRTVPELAAALESLIDSPRLRAELGARSLERSAGFTVKEFGSRVEKFYRWVADDFRHKRRASVD